MKKSKRNTYILLVVVLVIWGLIIYKFFTYRQSGTAMSQTSVEQGLARKPIDVKKPEVFTIEVNYRDPFLGKMNQTGQVKKSNVLRKKEVQPTVWPSIIYKGVVSDSKEKKKVFMLLIDQKPFFMKEKQLEGGVLLKSGDRKSITVQYEKQENKIYLQ